MSKQTAKDRAQRLENSCCPVHGIAMTQVGNTISNGECLFVAECPRRDCSIQGSTSEPHGPIKLQPEFQHLLAIDNQQPIIQNGMVAYEFHELPDDKIIKVLFSGKERFRLEQEEGGGWKLLLVSEGVIGRQLTRDQHSHVIIDQIKSGCFDPSEYYR